MKKAETMVSVRIRKDGHMADGNGYLKIDMSYQLPVSRVADLWMWLEQVGKRKRDVLALHPVKEVC